MNDGSPASHAAPVVYRAAHPKYSTNAGPIAFRLDEVSRAVLAERADQLGVSPHALARHYVLELLDVVEDYETLRQDIRALHSELNALRSDHALAVEALLVSAGKVAPADAHTWTEQNLLPCSPSPTP